ncbi:DgyrCDS10680 [Dimorphilus gyrociliatus]|uniref:General transcription factor IIH subunit n=1 Tax=Dimorphilus gyrociliatus TaxID=2664684 RepID=A0A7I8W0Z0_9ANNE|nr:DgyrCDS10680 [Dimorphilus gyrociliatus]
MDNAKRSGTNLQTIKMAAADDDIEKGYAWETEYERTWEGLTEDSSGSLQSSVNEIIRGNKKKQIIKRASNLKLGMIRYLFLVIDASNAMNEQDLKPNRLIATTKLLETFIHEFFDQNPISQLGIISTSNKRSAIISDLSGDIRRHLNSLQKLTSGAGEPSLQNSYEMAISVLKYVPDHSSREILTLCGSLTTCDPFDINFTIKTLREHRIRVSIIGLAAEVRIMKVLCKNTDGKYAVMMDVPHLKELLNDQVAPPPIYKETKPSLVLMGFPNEISADDAMLSTCWCHIKNEAKITGHGYLCPRCQAKCCDLPSECQVCGILLVSAPHLARSYHHLFPLAPFNDVSTEDALPAHRRFCTSCQTYLTDKISYQCQKCNSVFCVDCDVFIHDSLHTCPVCTSGKTN